MTSGPELPQDEPADATPRSLLGLVSELKVAVEAWRYLATHDQLTGLYNKAVIEATVEARIQEGQPFGVIHMDFDGFKGVNDGLGHPRGDNLLMNFAVHMFTRFRREGEIMVPFREGGETRETGPELVLGQVGGDEFLGIINLADRGRKDGLTVPGRMAKAVVYARESVDEFANEQVDLQGFRFGVSMGDAVWMPGSLDNAGALISRADRAMLQNKRERGAPAR